MALQVNFLETPEKKSEALILPVTKEKEFFLSEAILDADTQNFLHHVLKQKKKFKARPGQSFYTSLPEKAAFEGVIFLGFEPDRDSDLPENTSFEQTGGKLFPALKAAGIHRASLVIDKRMKQKNLHELAAHMAFGTLLRSYNFTRYKSGKMDDSHETGPEYMDVIVDTADAAEQLFKPLEQTAQGMFLARNLVNEPPNALHPDSFAKRIKDELKPLGVEVEILDEKKLQKLGMGAVLAVGMGSIWPPRVVIMRWAGTGKTSKKAPLAFVGKGITFDTGGISIKTSKGMETMKMDMGGAATVTGLMKALALKKAKADVVGIVALAENMPSDRAYRPSDIVKSYSGKTIEILNTDAEGRLVLVDCLSYVQEKYKPRTIVDLATLTGAMMVALGHEYCGVYANEDSLWSDLEKAGRQAGEKLWRMPLDPLWKKEMESQVADLQNLAKSGPYGGANTAAGFLEHFIEDKTPWAHMDIAGVAWIKSDKPTVPKNGTGFGVRTLEHYVLNNQ